MNSEHRLSAKISIDLSRTMFDTKSIFCQLPNSQKNSEQYDNNICYVNHDFRSNYLGIIGYPRTNYPDIPKSIRTLDRKRSIFTLEEQNKPIEPVFKDTRSQRTTNKDSHNYLRHIGSQTVYREESTQTDPFSPVYTISGGEHPEVFSLSDFTYGKGLPATSLEISFIERLRARREWEQDHTIDMTRTKLVIEREIREWQSREKEIQMLEDARHRLFTNNLHAYIQTDEDATQSIIDLAIYRQEKQLKLQHQRLEMKTSRDVRRIQRIYRLREAQINAVTSSNHLGVIGMVRSGNGCFSSLKPPWHTRSDDIITTFLNKISKISAPCPQFDSLIDRRMAESRLNIFQLEQLIPKNALIPQLEFLSNHRNKKFDRRIRHLETASQWIQAEKSKHFSTSEKKPLRFVERIERINPTKQSPTTPIQTEAHDQRRIAIIKFQNYLRCITVQSKIFNIYEIRHDLLDELRSGISLPRNQTDEVQSPRTQICDYLTNETIADVLDFLSKELLRLQSEQTIHLFLLLADRYRYQRESAETGTRTRSIEQQKLEDQAFQQMFSWNSDSNIQTYLEDLILQSISDTADQQARLEIQQITETLVILTDQIDQSDVEAVVSSLVHNFLIPTIQRILTERKSH